MLKYRRLTQEELESLEDEFVKFLAAQSISAGDWQRIKSDDINRQEELIQVFSNIVLERVLSGIEYLEICTKNDLQIVKMKDHSAHMLGIKMDDDTVDLQDDDQLNELFSSVENVMRYHPKIYEHEKKYTKTRAEEAFFLINLGAKVTDKLLYKKLTSLL
jgi:midasin (ATPase involved in ribosome maturation)